MSQTHAYTMVLLLDIQSKVSHLLLWLSLLHSFKLIYELQEALNC